MRLHPLHAIARAIRTLVRVHVLHDRSCAPCGCLLATVEFLDGQHPWDCKRDRFTVGDADGRIDCAPFRLGVPAQHAVDGVVMPWSYPGGSDVQRRWCDISAAGNGVTIARMFPKTSHYGIAARDEDDPDGWTWQLWDITLGDIDNMRNPELLTEGHAATAAEVLELVCKVETNWELAA